MLINAYKLQRHKSPKHSKSTIQLMIRVSDMKLCISTDGKMPNLMALVKFAYL